MWPGALFRTILAWTSAALTASFVSVALYAASDPLTWQSDPELTIAPSEYALVALVIAGMGAAIGAAPGWLAVALIRRASLARPWADIGGAIAVVLLTFVLVGLQDAVRNQTTDADDLMRYVGLLPALATGAALGGLVYWMVAGRPRPPY
jgi:hypothetical protein